MSSKLFIDFETRSAVDLKSCGAFRYAEHCSTQLMCMAWAFDEDEPQVALWSDLPQEVEDHVVNGETVCAHNFQFEFAIWNICCRPKYGWPRLHIIQGDCTMARAYAMSLPGGLDNAAAALGVDSRKDMGGHRLMLKLSQPKTLSPLTWYEDPSDLQRLYEYCPQDVRVTQQLDKRLLQLSPNERKVWVLDQTINARGVQCDVDAAKVATEVVEVEKNRLNAQVRELTGNSVATFTANQQLKIWLNSEGVKTDGVAKADVTSLLANDSLPHNIRSVLEIRQEGAKSSTAKIKSFVDRTGADQRIRGIFQYHGASTGRWAGRGIQPQNFPRPSLPAFAADDFFKHINETEYLRMMYGSVTNVVSNALRGFLIAAPGKTLYAADFNAIEARVLAWLAGEERILGLFRAGKDIYKYAAADIYGTSPERVTKEQRQIGKVAILALGYQGGVGAFQAMAKGYGVVLAPVAKDLWDRAPDTRRDKARWGWDQRGKKSGIDKREWIGAELIKLAWREANPSVVGYWSEVERKATEAVENPGHVVSTAGVRIIFRTTGSFLFCRLPSGRALCYPYPQVKETLTSWGEKRPLLRYKTEDSTTHKWIETAAYGGLLVENITQAVARDLLAEAMLRVEGVCLPTVLHVHDEIVAEVHEGHAYSLEDFTELVEEAPHWAEGLPLKAEGWSGRRYRK